MIKENWVEVKTYKATAYCDKCKEGKMIPTGIMKASNPPKYDDMFSDCWIFIYF